MTEEITGAVNQELSPNQKVIAEITSDMLEDARSSVLENAAYSIPIAQLSTLGAGFAALVPVFRTVTQVTSVETNGLYRLANAGTGDALKAAKDGNYWGAFKCADGTSKFAKLQSVGNVTQTEVMTLPIDPVTMLMAAALFSIEQKLDEIEKMQRQILSFLEMEKESAIEADVETLSSMISKYKYNWNNEHYLRSNHKLVLDLQRTARKNMLTYQKSVEEILESKQVLVAQSKIKSTLNELLKKFKYYRLSLYTFSLSALLEILLSGNFKEEYISGIKSEVDALAINYRDLFGRCSGYLEKLCGMAEESIILKKLGGTSDTFGKLISRIPKIKDGQLDEHLQESGARLKDKAYKLERRTLKAFSELSNPGTAMLMEKMQDLIAIYNHTAEICFDDDRLYFVAG